MPPKGNLETAAVDGVAAQAAEAAGATLASNAGSGVTADTAWAQPGGTDKVPSDASWPTLADAASPRPGNDPALPNPPAAPTPRVPSAPRIEPKPAKPRLRPYPSKPSPMPSEPKPAPSPPRPDTSEPTPNTSNRVVAALPPNTPLRLEVKPDSAPAPALAPFVAVLPDAP